MSGWEAILLGIVQGLTEFLPISSSGHLILVPWLQDYTFLQENDEFNKTFDVALHLGTLAAVVSYFRSDLGRMFVGWFRTLSRRSIETVDERLAWVVVVATIPAVIVGGVGEDWIDDNLGEPWMIAIALIVFGLLLGIADRRPQDEAVGEISLKQGLILGRGAVARALAGHLALGDHDHDRPVHGHRPRRRGADLVPDARPGDGGRGRRQGLRRDRRRAARRRRGAARSPESSPRRSRGTSRSPGCSVRATHNYDVFVIYRVVIGIGLLLLIATGVREATF